MKESEGGRPEIGPSARTLGVRPDVDIPVRGGMVRPGTGGLSVAPDSPANLPAHRRPPTLGGTGKDPVWSIEPEALGDRLRYHRDKPGHGRIEPAREMTIDEFQEALAETGPKWRRVP